MGKRIAAAVALGLLGVANGLEAGADSGEYMTHAEYLGVYQLLNVDQNIGLRFVDGNFKGQNYAGAMYGWDNGLKNFAEFQVQVFNWEGTTLLKWRADGTYKKLCIREAPYFTDGDESAHALVTSTTEIGVYPGDGLVDRFTFRRSKLIDNHGGRPNYLTALVGNNELALTAFPDHGDTYGEVSMSRFTDPALLTKWQRWYFTRIVPSDEGEGEAWKWFADGTFYIINQWGRCAMTTEKDEHHRIGNGGTWSDEGRMTFVRRDSPFFDIYSYSEKTRSRQPADTDFRIRVDNKQFKVGVGGTAGFKLVKSGDLNWGYLVNSYDGKKMYYNSNEHRHNDQGTGSGPNDKYEMLKVFSDCSTIAKADAPEL